ncbi:hypothetical protein ON064_03065 [Planococcus sp. A6]|uniref:hypothetical protein n=1 Tax=Planococcus sp. A6 TaxID=2992760 RepID=UPI00237B3226|nr:hypothetical protein [Planococcus sp. A6]MDE0582025.1 hypothetical protein [Planococcus sp. A6]
MNTHKTAKEIEKDLANDIERYNFFYHSIDSRRYELIDLYLSRSIVLDLDKFNMVASETASLAGATDFHTNLKSDNDYHYDPGVGFYLDNYVELAIPEGMEVSFTNDILRLGNFSPKYEISKPTSLYLFISNKEPAGQTNSNDLTLKIHGVDMEDFFESKEM